MLKNFFKNKSLVTLIAALLCVCIIAYFYNYRVNKIINTIEIPVAKYRLDARKEITKDDIKTVKVAKSLLSSNVVTNQQKLEGKYVNYNTFIPANGIFYDTAVVEWSSMPDSTWSNISEGKTIIYLDMSEGSAYGNSIYPGDRIDLYIKTMHGGKLVYGKFIESIKVLAVKDEFGNHIFQKSPSGGEAAQLIFEVDEDMFLLLKGATLLTSTFEIVPVPRNAQYTLADNATEISTDFFVEEIKKKVNILLPDIISEPENDQNIDVVE